MTRSSQGGTPSSVASTVDGDSAPVTPAINQFSPPVTRRRSNTFSNQNNDAALRAHDIFKLSEKNGSALKEFSRMTLQDDGTGLFIPQEQVTIAGYSPDQRGTRHVAFSPAVSTNVGEQQQISQEDIDEPGTTSSITDLDLAKNGLPSACVFVANLASSQTDEQLLASVEKYFKQFGRLHVKIRRDNKGNPYSFCQFESDEVARLAVTEGRHAIIDETGRRIRCEPAKVNRTLVLAKRDDSVITRDEVDKMLFGYGPLEAIEFSAAIGRTPTRTLNHGVRCFVRFSYRQDAVDCYQFFRCHQVWSADWTHNFPVAQLVPPTIERIHVQELDPESVFVGKLNPNQVTEDALRARFQEHGPIVEIHLLKKEKPGIGRIAFAFIKYENAEDAAAAIEAENNTEFLGNLIHVQQREVHKKAAQPAYTSAHHGINTQQPWLRASPPANRDHGRMTYELQDVVNLASALVRKLEDAGMSPAVSQNVTTTPSFSNSYQRQLLDRLVSIQNSHQKPQTTTSPPRSENRPPQEKVPVKQPPKPTSTPGKTSPMSPSEAFGMNRFYPYGPIVGFVPQPISPRAMQATLAGLGSPEAAAYNLNWHQSFNPY